MSLRRRGGHWWIDFVTPTGERVRRSTGTANRVLAQEYHDRLKAEAWHISKLGERPTRLWNEAVVRWLKEATHKVTIREDKAHLRWMDRFLGGKPLEAVTRSLIDHITDAKLAEGVSNATVNRMLGILRAILRKCVHEWEWLDKVPRVRMLKVPTRRVRFLSTEEALRLLSGLPSHLADMVAFSLATGLRRANVTGLQWTQVDMIRRLAWVHPDQAKARKPIPVPLNTDAVAAIRRRLGSHPTHVFSYKGSRSRRWLRRLGRRRSIARVSRTLGGMTYGIPGRAGTRSRARHCTRYRSWAVGRARRWFTLCASLGRAFVAVCGPSESAANR